MKLHRTVAGNSSLASLAALALLTTGCSNEEQKREYSIPGTLCGTAVDMEALTPFLPAGHKITVKDNSYSGTKGCQVIVDNKLILTTSQMWRAEGKTTAYTAARESLEALDHSADGGRFRYSDYEAFGKTRNCVDTKYKQELYTTIQAEGSKYRDTEAMKRLIVSFTKEVEGSVECTASAL